MKPPEVMERPFSLDQVETTPPEVSPQGTVESSLWGLTIEVGSPTGVSSGWNSKRKVGMIRN